MSRLARVLWAFFDDDVAAVRLSAAVITSTADAYVDVVDGSIVIVVLDGSLSSVTSSSAAVAFAADAAAGSDVSDGAATADGAQGAVWATVTAANVSSDVVIGGAAASSDGAAVANVAESTGVVMATSNTAEVFDV